MAMKNYLFPSNEQFWFECVRALGTATYGGAEIGEVIATAERIIAGDYDSWHDEWNAIATRLRREGDAQRAAGHRASARDSYQRAATYFRSAEFFLHGNPTDPRIAAGYDAQVACFRAWAELTDASIAPIEIPYEGAILHGYFYKPQTKGPWPVVIMHSGYDGSCEEMYFNGGAAARERGYAVVAFDGPGQPAARHRYGMVFRHDWEKVVTPVVDWTLAQPNIDRERIALMGCSLGGLLAPRAAAFERRLAACIAVDGVFRFPPSSPTGSKPADMSSPTIKWAAEQAVWAMGVKSLDDMAKIARDWNLGGGLAEQIKCATLVCQAEHDMFFKGQPEELFAHLTCPKTLLRFTDDEGAGEHCHPATLRMAYGRIYDWLDERLGRQTTA
jgi:dienelactone hydrolase